MRRPPVVATLVVMSAIAVMIGLGVWQLHRRTWKEDMLARFTAAERTTVPLEVTGTTLPANAGYRHIRWNCPEPGTDQVVGGRSATGQSGWAHVVVCTHRAGGTATLVPVVIGWSAGLAPVNWAGGALTGVAVPGPKSGVVLPAIAGGARALDWHVVADPPLAGLKANAAPDPRDIPNNHWSYAIQWFGFAATALMIYLLALRRR